MSDRSRLMRLKTASDRPTSLDAAALQRSEEELAGALVRAVSSAFPGYPWGVEVNFAGGVATLKLAALMNSVQCFCIHLDSVTSYPEMRREMRKAGGELLERFRLRRDGFDAAQYHDAEKLALRTPKQKVPE